MVDQVQAQTLEVLRRLERTMNDLPTTIMAAGTRIPRDATNKEKFKFQAKNPTKELADQKRMEKAMDDYTRASKSMFKDVTKISSDMLIAGSMFDKAVKEMSDKNFKRLPGQLDKVIGNLHGQIKSYEDVIRVQRRSVMTNVDKAEELYKRLINPSVQLTAKEMDMLSRELETTGYDLHDFSGYTKDAAGTMKMLRDNAEEGAKGLHQVAQSSFNSGSRWEAFGKVAKMVGGAALILGQYLMTSAKAAMMYGTEAAPLQAFLAGMSPEAFAKLQHDNIQAARAGFKSLDEFNSKVVDGADALFVYTGSLEAGAKLTAANLNTYRSFTKNTSMQNDFIAKQNTLFISMNRTIGTTSEEFQQMNDTLMNSNNVQAQMYKLSEAQRVVYFQNLESSIKQLQIDGLTQQQAMHVVETFQQIAGQKPQDRIKQAAKLQAIGGAIGLAGPDLNRLADLIRSGMRGPGDQAEAAAIEARLQPQLQAITANQSATLGTETSFRALVDQVPELLGANNIAAGLGVTGKGLNDAQVNAAMTRDYLGNLAGPHGEVVSGFSQTVAGVAKLENRLQVVGSDIKGTLDKGFGFIGGLLEVMGVAGGLKGLLGRGATGVATAAGEAGLLATVGTAITGLVASGAVVTAGYSLFQAIRGKDSSNFISNWDAKNLGIGPAITDWLTDTFGPKVKEEPHHSVEWYKKEGQLHNLQKQAEEERKAGHQDAVKALTAQIQALTAEIAKMKDGDAASKAVDKLHKTVKDQHQEDKQMTQDQTDVFNKTHQVIMKKTTRDVLGPSY